MKHAELVELEKKATNAPMKEIFLYEWRNAAPAYFDVVKAAKALVEYIELQPYHADRVGVAQEALALREALAAIGEG